MTRTTLKAACLLWLLACSASRVAANDIENFLRALRNNSRPNPSGPPVVAVSDHHGGLHERGDRGYSGGSGRWSGGGGGGGFGRGASGMSSRDAYKRHQQFVDNHRRYDFDGNHYDLRNDDFRNDYRGGRGYGHHPVNIGGRTGTRISFSFGGSGYGAGYGGGYDGGFQEPLPVPAVPVYPQPPVQTFPVIPQQPVIAIPHELGEIVTCPVPIATCVRIEDPEKIAPNAVPVVVAVRDPNLPPHAARCVERLVYVEVCVPQCPLRSLTISPCKTKIRMDYGHYGVDIRSCHGEIVIDYDN